MLPILSNPTSSKYAADNTILGDSASEENSQSAGESTFQSFPNLLSLEEINVRRMDYRGPTDESNWVIPSVLLVGAYPSSLDDEQNKSILLSILRLGVTTFVCLQHEYRHSGITEYMWRNGLALRLI